MTTVNITISTVTSDNNTNQTINPNKEPFNNNPSNVYIPTTVCNTCRAIKYIT